MELPLSQEHVRIQISKQIFAHIYQDLPECIFCAKKHRNDFVVVPYMTALFFRICKASISKNFWRPHLTFTNLIQGRFINLISWLSLTLIFLLIFSWEQNRCYFSSITICQTNISAKWLSGLPWIISHWWRQWKGRFPNSRINWLSKQAPIINLPVDFELENYVVPSPWDELIISSMGSRLIIVIDRAAFIAAFRSFGNKSEEIRWGVLKN